MFDLKALESQHKERTERLTELQTLLQEASKWGDMQQQINVYLKQLGSIVRQISTTDRGFIDKQVWHEISNYLPLDGSMQREINGLEINALHHIANLMKPVHVQS